MNINTLDFVDIDAQASLESEVREHHSILVVSGIELTGAYILIPEDAALYPCSMQVWSETAGDPPRWVFVDTEGVVHTRANPLIGQEA